MLIINEYSCFSLHDTRKAGQDIAEHLKFPACVYLQGEMGSGKTTLSKSIIKSLGYEGDVTSPTYNLIHEYPIENGVVYHLDLYRLNDPEELEYLAVDDLWSVGAMFLIEWPERGQGYLRPADFKIRIESKAKHRPDQNADRTAGPTRHIRLFTA